MITSFTSDTKRKEIDVIIKVPVDLNKVQEFHCVYHHYITMKDANGEPQHTLMWVGFCPFSQLLTAPDARRNTEWRKYVADAPIVTIEVAKIYENVISAYNEMARQVKQHRPHCNMRGVSMTTNRIRCITDGREFENASKAATFYGIHRSSMSNHLNGRKGYDTVRSLKFERM